MVSCAFVTIKGRRYANMGRLLSYRWASLTSENLEVGTLAELEHLSLFCFVLSFHVMSYLLTDVMVHYPLI